MNPNDNSAAAASDEPIQLERLSRWLIQHAARNSPAALSERLEEEWLAHLATQRGTFSRLYFALGCCWAMRVIAHDYLASRAPASSAATGHGSIILGHHDLSYFSRRTTILFLIVCLHAFVIYGFATGFAQKVIESMPGPIVGSFLNPPKTPIPLPPPIVSGLVTPRTPPIVPDVTPVVQFPTESLTQVPIPPPAPPSQPPSLKTVTRILGGPGAGFPNTEDYYPVASRHLGEMGVATVRVCVDERGRLASAPMIMQSSGKARLDDAAVLLAKAGSGHYRSTTEDGVAVSSCYPYRIRFQIKQ
jgi:TonB family protein